MNKLPIGIAVILLVIGLIFGVLAVTSYLQYREDVGRGAAFLKKSQEASARGEKGDAARWADYAKSDKETAQIPKNEATWFGIISSFAIIIAVVLLVDLYRKRRTVRTTNFSPPRVR